MDVERAARGPRAAAVSRLQTVTFAGPSGALEGLVLEREAHDHTLAAIVCHPHPLYGGTLHNKVVHRVASVLHGLGGAILRFNFRGVGASEGRFDGGGGELEDARAALAWMRARYPSARRWAAGFSFGAWVAARLAASESDVERVILVAPPVATEDFSVLRQAAMPKLVVQGMNDDLCTPAALDQAFPGWAEPKTILRVEGATHFFDRQLGALAEVLHQALAGSAGGATS
jgi:alpha/beta superfamily hydrolase